MVYYVTRNEWRFIMKVCFYTLGCKVNQYETQLLEEQFEKAGFQISAPGPECDVFVVNSCTVTGTGDKKTRNMLHRFKRMNPNGICVLTGCFPQAFPNEAIALGADIVTGTVNKSSVVRHVLTAMQTGLPIVDLLPHTKHEKIDSGSITKFNGRTRAFIKIQDGCDNRCTYCIIPKARGSVRSKSPEDIKKEAEALAASGYKEIVLVGINLCFYGRDIGFTFSDAISAACSADGIERVRLGSLEPELISSHDLAVMASEKKLCPSFHLALQSGCDKTLHKMARRYDTAFYLDLVQKIRSHFPNAAFTTDIMVGFPEESDEDFAQSVAFMKEVGFADAHVFTYSIRPGTPAESFVQVPSAKKTERTHMMLDVCRSLRASYLNQQIGTILHVLAETRHSDGTWEGFSENYCTVEFSGSSDLHGSIVPVRIIGSNGTSLTGCVES